MIDRVAIAIGRAEAEGGGYKDLARAAIEAMREPTRDMRAKGSWHMEQSPENVWRVMIDAALEPSMEQRMEALRVALEREVANVSREIT
jgi:hypothetical protein